MAATRDITKAATRREREGLKMAALAEFERTQEDILARLAQNGAASYREEMQEARRRRDEAFRQARAA